MKNKHKKQIFVVAMLLLLAFCVWASFAESTEITQITPTHEGSGKTHVEGGTGPCYGWARTGDNIRVCYTDKEQQGCKYLIYINGIWHESDIFPCTELEDDNEKNN